MGPGTRQHHVPQFYLRSFAIDPARKLPQLHVLDLDNQRRFVTGTHNVCVQVGYFDVDGEAADDNFDVRLTAVEDAVRPAVLKLIDTGDATVLTPDERLNIAIFVLVQHLRVAAERDRMRDFRQAMREGLLRRDDAAVVDGLRKKYFFVEENAVLDHSYLIGDVVSQCARDFATRPWHLYRPPPGAEFATSDNPVIKINPMPPPNEMSNQGLECVGTTLKMALTPTLLLVISDPRVPGMPPEWEGTLVLHPDHADVFHHLLVDRAERMVFSRLAFGVRSAWLRGRGRPTVACT